MAGRVRVPAIAAVAIVVAGCLVVAFEARDLTFSGDDWTFVLSRRGFSADVFLRPHNEHLSALPILAYKVLLELFGASSYAPFMALLIVVHGVACLLLYAVVRRHVGPWLALAPTAVLVVLGPAWHDLLWAFQVTYLGSVAAGLGMVLCLERRDRAGDVAAAALLGVSLLCSSVGLGFVVLAAVLLALDRPRIPRRLWVVAAPVALYAAWYAVYGVGTARSGNFHRIPGYLAHALSAGVASATALAQTHDSPYLVSTSYGRYVALAAVVLTLVHLVRGGRLPALGWAALAAAFALWTAQCLAYFPNGREAEQSRYQYVTVVLLLVAGACIAAGRRWNARGGALLGVAAVAVCASNVAMLDERAGFWTDNSRYAAAELGAMEIARDRIDPSFAPENLVTAAVIGVHNVQPVRAGTYFSAVDAFGSPADSPTAILARPERVREAADLVLGAAERLRLQRAVGRPPADARCRSLPRAGSGRELLLGPGTLWIRVEPGSTVQVQLRRFASAYRFVRLRDLTRATHLVLRLPRDRSTIPWRARAVGTRSLRLCPSA